MNVLSFYADRMESLTFRDKTDRVLVLRRGKSMSPRTIADGKVIVTNLDTDIKNGDIVTRDSGEQLIIITKQQSADCVQMQGRRVNGKVNVVKLKDTYVNHKKTGVSPVVVASDVPVYFVEVNAAMRQYDAGLLQTTVKKIIIQPMDVALLDRIQLNGRNYQVVNVDTASYVNLLELQVAEDNRK